MGRARAKGRAGVVKKASGVVKKAASKIAAVVKASRPPVAKRATKADKAPAVRALSASAQKITPAMRERASALLAQIARRKQRIGEDFYEIGLALKELADKKLYVALGHATFKEMLQERGVMSPAQAHKLMTLVESVPREQALVLGQEKAAALVAYTRATPELDTPRTVLESGVLPKGKRAADATVRDLIEATAHVRKKAGRARKVSPEQKQAEQEAKALQVWLRKRGAKGATASVVRRGGALWIRMEVPAGSAADLQG